MESADAGRRTQAHHYRGLIRGFRKSSQHHERHIIVLLGAGDKSVGGLKNLLQHVVRGQPAPASIVSRKRSSPHSASSWFIASLMPSVKATRTSPAHKVWRNHSIVQVARDSDRCQESGLRSEVSGVVLHQGTPFMRAAGLSREVGFIAAEGTNPGPEGHLFCVLSASLKACPDTNPTARVARRRSCPEKRVNVQSG